MRMRTGAQTPEELEMLLEDALLLGDQTAVATLFARESVLAGSATGPVRGRVESARRALSLWDAEHPYLADPQQVVVSRDLGLVISECGTNVVRRNRSGLWQFAIVALTVPRASEKVRP
jgi:hypothetical protein